MSGKKNHFISFIGAVGSGKTTAMELAAKELGFFPIKERYRQNNFLPLFYQDMKKWALASQLFFLFEKFDQMLSVGKITRKKSVVLDVDINQDLCYMLAQRKLGNLNPEEYSIYCRIYENMRPLLPRPDLIVYLMIDPEFLKERIDARGRSFESGITCSYLRALAKAQEEWIRKNKERFNIVTVDTKKINFATDPKGKKEFIRIIRSGLRRSN